MPTQQLFRFIDYLTTSPHIHDLCEHLLNDFNLPEHPERVRITWKLANSALEVIGEYGYEEEDAASGGICIGKSFEYEHWSCSMREGMEVIKNEWDGPWSQNGNVYVHKITYNFLILGFVTLVFEDLDDAKRAAAEERLQVVLALVNLYVVQEMRRIHLAEIVENQVKTPANICLDAKTRFSMLTPRQVQIMALIGQEKTNAQIGKALGYATTTIHAECSDIYQRLAVGNRSQAFALVSQFLGKDEIKPHPR